MRLGCAVGMCGWDVRLGCAVGMCGWDVRLGCAVGMCGWVERLGCALGMCGWCSSSWLTGTNSLLFTREQNESCVCKTGYK